MKAFAGKLHVADIPLLEPATDRIEKILWKGQYIRLMQALCRRHNTRRAAKTIHGTSTLCKGVWKM